MSLDALLEVFRRVSFEDGLDRVQRVLGGVARSAAQIQRARGDFVHPDGATLQRVERAKRHQNRARATDAESSIGASESFEDAIDVGASGVGLDARVRRVFPRRVRGENPRGRLRAGRHEFAAKVISLALVFRLERHQVLLRGGETRRGVGDADRAEAGRALVVHLRRVRREISSLVGGGGAVHRLGRFARGVAVASAA
jgi:hypothetical protein